MGEFLQSAQDWFLSLGEMYGVNPIIFGSIYVGAIPFFTLSIAWLVRNYKRKASIVLPAISSLFFFISAYLYLIIAGENVPWWVYAIMVGMVSYGGWATYQKIQRKIHEEDPVEEEITN